MKVGAARFRRLMTEYFNFVYNDDEVIRITHKDEDKGDIILMSEEKYTNLIDKEEERDK